MKAYEVELLIERFGTDVYRFCLKLCGNVSDAEDLYQQTFLRMMEIKSSIQWEDNPKSFLFSICNSIWKNDKRKKARRMRIAPTQTIEDENEYLLVASECPDEEVFVKLRNDKLHEIIESLPDQFRIPIILFYLFSFSIEEIATTIKIPIGTVKSRLHKGRRLIKKRLEECGYDE